MSESSLKRPMRKHEEEVAVVGYSITPFIRDTEIHWRKFLVDVVYNTLEKAKLEPEDIQVGSLGYNERSIPEGALGPVVIDALGLDVRVPMIAVSNACAAGGLAHFNVVNFLASKKFDIGLVITFQKAETVDIIGSMDVIGNRADYDAVFGFSHIQYSQLQSKKYREKYGYEDYKAAGKWCYDEMQMAVKNPLSVKYKSKVPTLEEYQDPGPNGVKLRQVAGRGPTATATILARREIAETLTDKPIITDSHFTFRSPYIGEHYNWKAIPEYAKADITNACNLTETLRELLRIHKVEKDDIGVVQVHDLSPEQGMMAIEGLGIVPEGKAGEYILEGGMSLDSEVPINTFGGFVGFGHSSVGSDFHGPFFENCDQLLGKAANQVKDVEVAINESYGTHRSMEVVGLVKKGW
ncbi:MAG: thiolase family protein [Candidatus Hodarchaeales archaeon]